MVLGAGSGFFGTAAKAAWKPTKPVAFVIMAEKGSGADRLARFILGIIKKQKLSGKPFVALNKGRDAGAEALRHMRDKVGDGHVVMLTLNSYYTTPLRDPDLGVDIGRFTPIARLAEDTFQLWVHAEAGIRSVSDFVAAVKKAGAGKWRIGGAGEADSLVSAMFQDAYGIELAYVPLTDGAAVARRLMDNGVHATVNNPSEQLRFWQGGRSLPLASFTAGRLNAFPNVPTFREIGHDLVYVMQRSIVAPPGIERRVQAYYVGVFSKLYKSKAWQDYMAKEALQPGWLTGSDLTRYFVSQREAHRRILDSLGEIP
jgi:tripartite-type tricarboxylate transporter receptor subunit TctC